MQLLINPGVTTIADCSEMEGDALSDVDGEGALLNPINFLGEERRYEDEDGGFEMDSENGQLEGNEDRADTDIEEAGPEVGGVASSEGRDSHAEDEETRGTLEPAATVVDVPPKDCSFPRRQRPRRPVVLMISDYIDGDETTGDGGGAEVDMDTETSEVEDSVNGAIGIGGNYSAASAVPSVRRAFSFAASVDHSSSQVTEGTIQPHVLLLAHQASDRRTSWLNARVPPLPPPYQGRGRLDNTNEELRAQTATLNERGGTRRWETPRSGR